MNKRAFRADILLLLTAGIWGFGFVAQSSGMDYLGPFTYNGIRFILGSLSLVPLMVILRIKKRRDDPLLSLRAGKKIRYTFIAGSVLFVAVAFQQIGIIFTTVGNAGFITGFYVVLTPVFGIVLGKKTHLPTWAGMVCALTGLYFISLAGSHMRLNPGDLFTVISSVFWACHILVVDHLVQKIDPLTLSSGQFAWCGVFAFIAALLIDPLVGSWAAHLAPAAKLQSWVVLSDIVFGQGGALWDARISLLYGGLASAGIAYTLQVVAQKDAPPAHATIILCLEGAFAAFGGIVIRGEQPTAFTLLGFIFMLAGMMVTQLDVIRRQDGSL
ncbi:MAG: DMT family transporter [Treponema sp.]|jgi:drug/metabolite transporter (DMT)-like permease|nr:DMT family transporter [Treponema sp.]